jgi:23S rRNA pseudouridine1911/1915/1917 synthase
MPVWQLLNMPISKLDVLYEDNHLLAVIKPAGLATMGTSGNKPTMLSIAKDYIKHRYKKPGNVYLGVMSRLDAQATGVVLFARTSKAAARLTEQFRTRVVDKTYWAIVEEKLEPAEGCFTDFLGKDEANQRMRIVGQMFPGAKAAKLTYRSLRNVRGNTLIEIILETGRKHQIRLQFAHHGHSILGDRKYGSRQSFPSGIALHARRLVVKHPINADPIILEAPLPATWHIWGVSETP